MTPQELSDTKIDLLALRNIVNLMLARVEKLEKPPARRQIGRTKEDRGAHYREVLLTGRVRKPSRKLQNK